MADADSRRERVAPGEVAVYRPGEPGAREGAGYRGLNRLQRWSMGWPSWAQGPAKRLQAMDLDPANLTTGQVVGLSVGAATAVGGLIIALEPEPVPPLPQPVERAIAALPRDRRKQARRAARRARRRTARSGRNAVEQAREGAGKLGENVGGALSAAGGAIAGAGGALAERVRPEEGPMSAVQERVEEARKRGRKMTRRGRKNIEKQLRELDKQREKLQKRAGARA